MRLKIKNLEIPIIDVTLLLYLFAVIVTDEGSSFMKITRVIMLMICLVLILKEKKIRIYKYLGALILFWAFSTFSIRWSHNKQLSIDMSKTILINLITIYCFIYLINFNKKRIELVLKAIIIFPILLEMRAVYYGGIFVYLNSRISGTISANTIGMCSAFAASITLYYIMKKQHTMIYMSLFTINVIILLLSSSRKAILCLLIPIGIVYVFNNKNRLLNIMLKSIIIVILAIALYYLIINIDFLYNTVGHRMESLINGIFGDSYIVDASAKTRMNLINWGIGWFKENKWIGYGIDNFRAVLTATHSDYPLSYYAHNNYVELLVDVGLIGTMLYYFTYARILFIGIIKRKKVRICSLIFIGILIAILVSEIGIVSYFDRYIQMLIALTWIIVKYEAYNKNNELAIVGSD